MDFAAWTASGTRDQCARSRECNWVTWGEFRESWFEMLQEADEPQFLSVRGSRIVVVLVMCLEVLLTV